MDDLDAVFQLVFFALIALGWVIKAAVEAKQKKQRKSALPPAVDPTGSPMPPTPARPPARLAPAPASVHTQLEGEARRRHPGPDPADRSLAAGPRRVLQSSAAAIAQGVGSRRVQRASVLRRLSGGLKVAPGRELTRAGVLWSEVLGPCRAMKGPHRSPTAERARRG